MQVIQLRALDNFDYEREDFGHETIPLEARVNQALPIDCSLKNMHAVYACTVTLTEKVWLCAYVF